MVMRANSIVRISRGIGVRLGSALWNVIIDSLYIYHIPYINFYEGFLVDRKMSSIFCVTHFILHG